MKSFFNLAQADVVAPKGLQAVGVQVLRPQPFFSLLASARRQGFAPPGRKKRGPPLTPLRGRWVAASLFQYFDYAL